MAVSVSPAVMSDMMIKQVTGLMTASNYQMDVFRHIAIQSDAMGKRQQAISAVVKAVAGSGKTTTALASCALVERLIGNPYAKIVFLAFNAPVKEELAERLRLKGSRVQAKTLNGLGFGILGQYVRTALNISSMGKPDTGKTRKILRNLISPEEYKRIGTHVTNLVAKCKAMGVVPEGMGREVVGLNDRYATNETLSEIARHFQLRYERTVESAVFNTTRDVLMATINEVLNCNSKTAPVFDFDDQKYLPVVIRPNGKPMAMTKYDAIFLDEAQDVNPVDLEMVKLSLKKGGMVIAIGDDRQAIYGFRGADVNSINNIKSTFGAIELPLSITYRCATDIVAVASEIYEGIEAAPNAPKGEVVSLDKYDHTLFRPGDMIICRNNAPLVAMAFALIRRRVPVHMMGRDFGKDLIKLIEGLAKNERDPNGPYADCDVRELSERIDNWEVRQIAIIRDKDGDDAAMDAVRDRADTIRVFISDNHDGKVETIISEVNELFNTDSYGAERVPAGKVILSSGHRSKGLESERVHFLDSHLLYPDYVKEGSWQAVQEQNLHYVIVTRAKLYLGHINSKDMV